MTNKKSKGKTALENHDFISDGKKVVFYPTRFINYLEELGYRKVEVGNTFKIVHVNNYIVTESQVHEIKSRVLEDIRTNKGENETDYLISKISIFSLNYLSAISTINITMNRDTAKKSYLYFLNGVIEVTKTKVSKPIPYSNFKKYIWKEHIINHDFTGIVDYKNLCFYDFINKVSNNEQDWFLRICTTIGYCLNDYKTAATSRAVIITDAIVSNMPEGGSGKSLICEAISKLRKTIKRDGQSFRPNKDFQWIDIDESVRIITIDDVSPDFNFESLFSLITGGFNIERKTSNLKIVLPVEQSPKFIITSNHVLKGGSGSFSRRQITLDIFQYFNKHRTPLNLYGKTFFNEWDKKEWQQFYSFMIICIQLYFKQGISKYQETEQAKKELIRFTSLEFAEWINGDEGGAIIELTKGFNGSTDKRDQYLYETNQRNLKLTIPQFLSFIDKFCELYGYNFTRKSNGVVRGFVIEKQENSVNDVN